VPDDFEGFFVEFRHAVHLKRFFSNISKVYDEINITCTPEGISGNHMCPAHISVIDFNIDPGTAKNDAVRWYRCSGSIVLGLSVASIVSVFECAADSERVRMTVVGKEPGEITFEFGEDSRFSRWNVKLLEIMGAAYDIPVLEYDTHVEVSASTFKTAIDKCHKMSDDSATVVLSVDDESRFSISVANTTSGSEGGFTFCADDADVDITSAGVTTVEFSSEKLHRFTTMANLSARVHISLSEQVPSTFKFDFAGMGKIEYFLAPKIPDSEW
jgi:proliferating cell nuclear antigen PCNA